MCCQPRKMSDTVCISRCPSTTRWPALGCGAGVRYASNADGPASLACKNNGSPRSRPTNSSIQQRVPTLPTPTTLWAMSTSRYWSNNRARSGGNDAR